MVHLMKKLLLLIRFTPLALLCVMLNAQDGGSEIIGIWEFQTMTSVYYSEPKEITTTVLDKNHRETLTFRADGSFSYRGVYDGVEDASVGVWKITKVKLTMDVRGEKTICNYEVNGKILTLTFNEKESDEFYGTNSVLKYKNRLIGSKF